MRDSREKGAGIRDQDPLFQTLFPKVTLGELTFQIYLTSSTNRLHEEHQLISGRRGNFPFRKRSLPFLRQLENF